MRRACARFVIAAPEPRQRSSSGPCGQDFGAAIVPPDIHSRGRDCLIAACRVVGYMRTKKSLKRGNAYAAREACSRSARYVPARAIVRRRSPGGAFTSRWSGESGSKRCSVELGGRMNPFGSGRAVRARRGGRGAGRLGRSGARPASLAHPVFQRRDPIGGHDLRRGRVSARRVAWPAPARAAGNLLCLRRRRLDEPRRPRDPGKGRERGVHSWHGRTWNPPDGKRDLRLFYAFPVNSFDGVEYLFSAAPLADGRFAGWSLPA